MQKLEMGYCPFEHWLGRTRRLGAGRWAGRSASVRAGRRRAGCTGGTGVGRWRSAQVRSRRRGTWAQGTTQRGSAGARGAQAGT